MSNPEQLRAVLAQQAGPKDLELLRGKEKALLQLGEYYRDNNDANGLAEVVRSSRSLMEHLAKAKTAKLIRALLDLFSSISGSSSIQIQVTEENIEWAKAEKQIFLKQNLQVRLISLLIDNAKYRQALELIETLLKELKKLDDKMILTEVHLLESRVNHALRNLPRSKTALTSARTSANSIYCPPLLQAQLDLQSGVLHADDKDYKTAYSYFFEALEGFAGQDDPKATAALKYMLLCKIMLNLPEDVTSLISGKIVQRYLGPEVDAMKAVAKAHESRSLSDFEKALQTHKKELSEDPIIRTHLAALYDTLLEQNLIRIIEPYSRVEITHIAQMVGQSVKDVESKLSQMILDKVFYGILDQGVGCLIVFEEPTEDKTHEATLATIANISQTVELLFEKSATIQ